VQVVEQEPFQPGVLVQSSQGGPYGRVVLFVHGLVRLEVQAHLAPRAGKCEIGLLGENATALQLPLVPARLHHDEPRVADGAHEVERSVPADPHVDDHLVNQRKHGTDGRDDGVVKPDGVADEGEAGDPHFASDPILVGKDIT